MSIPDAPFSGPPAEPPPRRSVGTFLAIVLTLIGIVLLLPGACALFFLVAFGKDGAGSLVVLWLICFTISAGGIWLIVYAVRNR